MKANITIRCMDGQLYTETIDAPDTIARDGGDPAPFTTEDVAVQLYTQLHDLGCLALNDAGSMPRTVVVVPIHNVHSIAVTDVTGAAEE